MQRDSPQVICAGDPGLTPVFDPGLPAPFLMRKCSTLTGDAGQAAVRASATRSHPGRPEILPVRRFDRCNVGTKHRLPFPSRKPAGTKTRRVGLRVQTLFSKLGILSAQFSKEGVARTVLLAR
jgi:hypothetical protein